MRFPERFTQDRDPSPRTVAQLRFQIELIADDPRWTAGSGPCRKRKHLITRRRRRLQLCRVCPGTRFHVDVAPVGLAEVAAAAQVAAGLHLRRRTAGGPPGRAGRTGQRGTGQRGAQARGNPGPWPAPLGQAGPWWSSVMSAQEMSGRNPARRPAGQMGGYQGEGAGSR